MVEDAEHEERAYEGEADSVKSHGGEGISTST
jgi:hypothetical protein